MAPEVCLNSGAENVLAHWDIAMKCECVRLIELICRMNCASYVLRHILHVMEIVAFIIISNNAEVGGT